MSLQGIAELKASFERVQHEAQIDDDIDWDFWGQIISDYETVARTQPRQLSKMIQKGIPQALRGMIWQLMSKSKDSELESTYAQLLKETSTHEKMIMRDLNRTFPKHEFFKDQDGLGQEGLFNVVKAYSLYDTEVGYCQGISFVVGPLLLNMPDEEAFCVLVKLMTFYNMRSHFLPGMDGLQLRLYQFDRLVEEMLPKVHNHLQAQGINSSMYASQWFMTLFAYKFPLSLVFRIYDTIFTEGIEAIFRFSIALLKKNEKRIVEMEFETLLEYLKSGLFENYQINHTGVLAQLVKETQYHTNDFVKDAYDIRITPKKLNKYQQAYYAHQEAEKRKLLAEAEAIEKLRSNNIQLSSRVKQLEGSLQTLNREHVELANELINTRMELAKSNDENKELHSTIEELHKIVELQPAEIEAKLREEMNILAKKNISLVQKNNLLEDQLANLENMLIESKMRYAESENEREVLQRKWNDLKKALG
ncbi:RabGAP/TBC [Rhizophagus irregularis]|uniref:RabGAP/TBC n=1 Tax=Rhizophagus irregularis TaxID=588596 RepID=A0A2N1NVT8_9GLOM|nr:RabGAP/TBC [Rhizophagus irregularis]